MLLRTISRYTKVIDTCQRKMSSSSLYSWGVGTQGQLGYGNFEVTAGFFESSYVQIEPKKIVTNNTKFSKIAVGDGFTLGLCATTNSIYGWGQGQVVGIKESDKSGTLTAEPRLISMPSNDIKIVDIVAGSRHAAAIDTNGLVYTWGNGGSWMSGGGQLGHNSTTSYDKPELIKACVEYDVRAKSVSCGASHTLILTDDNEVLSFGVGEFGRLGLGSSNDVLIPTPIDTLADLDITQVVASGNHSMVLTSSGSIYSWGKNNMGQLGHSDSYVEVHSMEELPRLIESDVLSEFKIKSIAASKGRSAALTECGQLIIWGNKLSHVPSVIEKSFFDGLKIVMIALGGQAGKSVTAAVTEDGSLWTFGDSSSYILGRKSSVTGKNPEPTRIPAFKNKKATDIFCGTGKIILNILIIIILTLIIVYRTTYVCFY